MKNLLVLLTVLTLSIIQMNYAEGNTTKPEPTLKQSLENSKTFLEAALSTVKLTKDLLEEAKSKSKTEPVLALVMTKEAKALTKNILTYAGTSRECANFIIKGYFLKKFKLSKADFLSLDNIFNKIINTEHAANTIKHEADELIGRLEKE